MSSPGSIALFGGTFDPIHLGHVMISEKAKETMNLDQVRFIPCQISPHKTGHAPTPAHHRLEMIRLAIRDYPWAVADDFELSSSEPSYSYLTVAETRRQHPEARIFWIMGYDQWNALPRWKEPEKLAAEVEFIVFSRSGDPQPRAGWRLHKLQGTHPASATVIRDSVRTGHPRADWLSPDVLNYIRINHLYTP